tara:strand:- start:879 stop:1040 length:162 start_codon:yes stop_codon:yes gene_type:complete
MKKKGFTMPRAAPKVAGGKKKPLKKMMGGGAVRFAGNKKGGKGGQTRMAVKYR